MRKIHDETAQELERSRAELAAIYEHAPVLMCTLGADRRVLYANSAFTRFTGVSEAELRQGRACGVFGCINARDDPRGCGFGVDCQDCRIRLAIEDTLRTGHAHHDVEYKATLERDGNRREVILLGSTVRIPREGGANLLLCLQDITDRRRAEELLAQSERWLKLVMDASNDGMWDWTIPSGHEEFSPRYQTMLGYLAGELSEHVDSWRNLVHPEDLPAAERRQTEHIEGTTDRYRAEFRMRTKSGEWLWVLSRGKVVERDPAGKAVRVVGTHIDISERKRAEKALLESEAKFRSSFMTGRDVHAIITMEEGRVVEANDAIFAVFGYTRDEAIGRTLRELGVLSEEARRAWSASESGAAIKIHDQEMQATTKSGSMVTCSFTASEILLSSTPHLLCIFRDISEVKRAEQELISSHANLRKLARHLLHAREEERRKIAQEIHDELGQILTALKMDLHWVAKRLGLGAKPVLEKIEGAIQLADQTLGVVQRISSELRPRMLDDLGLAASLEWLARDFTRRTGIACATDLGFDERLVGGIAATEFYRIAQEALTNVVRHAKASQVQIQLRQAGPVLELTVQDNGIGITPAQASDPRSFGLIGLRERGQALGGSMSIEGAEGRGSVLRVSVPLPAEGGLA